jgi:hypothetical protein
MILFWIWVTGCVLVLIFGALNWWTAEPGSGGVMGDLPRDIAILMTFVGGIATIISLALYMVTR